MVDQVTTQASQDTSFFGHPKGLAVLFFAEMWERFSYYGMRALLVFYVTQHFLFDDSFGQTLYGTYASLVYLMPVLGGFLADRYLGQKKAVMYGAILLVLGHFGMAFEGSQATQKLDVGGQLTPIEFVGRADARESYATLNDVRHRVCGTEGGIALVPVAAVGSADCPAEKPENTLYFASANALAAAQQEVADLEAKLAATPADQQAAVARELAQAQAKTQPIGPVYTLITERDEFYVGVFYLALSLIIMGVCFLKANISSVVGTLYAENDSRRDQGFTIFYMGINLGSVMATLLCGYLGQVYGWAYGFGLAGFGMLLGFLVFARGQEHLIGHGDAPDPEKLKQPFVAGISRETLIYLAGFAGVFVVWQLIQFQEVVRYSLTAVTVIAIVGVILFSFGVEKFERDRLWTALALIFFSVVFWMLFEQAGSSLNLYAQRNSDLSVFGLFDMTASQAQFFNPAMIVICAPLFSIMWSVMASRGVEPSTPVKFAMGLILVGLGFLVLVFGAQFADGDFQVPLIWLVLAYLFHSTGELCLSPVGLSMITKLSVARIVSLMMGIWFLSSAIAHSLAGLIAAATSTETIGGQTLDKGQQLATYVDVFTDIGLLGVAVGVVVLLISPILKKGMHGVH